MKVRVFYPNKTNHIEFTKEQLEKLLDEVYDEGHAKGYGEGYTAGLSATPSVPLATPYTPIWYGDKTTPLRDYTITCSDVDGEVEYRLTSGFSIGDEK